MYKVYRVCFDGRYGGGKFNGIEHTCTATFPTLNEAMNALAYIHAAFPDSKINDSGDMLIRKRLVRENIEGLEDVSVIKCYDINIYYYAIDITNPWSPMLVQLQ